MPAASVTRLFVVVVVALLTACGDGPATPEDRVRGVIDGIERALEQGSVEGAAIHLHPGYRDHVHANKAMALRSLLLHTRRHRSVHLFTLVRSVDVAADQSTAHTVVIAAMTGRPADSVDTLLSLDADLYRFDVDMVRVDDEWLVGRSEWRRVDVAEL